MVFLLPGGADGSAPVCLAFTLLLRDRSQSLRLSLFGSPSTSGPVNDCERPVELRG
jgi:hypothetical protein